MDVFEEAVKREQEIIRLKDEISRLTENQRLQDSATAAVMERAEKAEAELAACREDAEKYQWMERNWYRAYDAVTKCFQPFTNRMGELADRVKVAIDAARKEGGA